MLKNKQHVHVLYYIFHDGPLWCGFPSQWSQAVWRSGFRTKILDCSSGIYNLQTSKSIDTMSVSTPKAKTPIIQSMYQNHNNLTKVPFWQWYFHLVNTRSCRGAAIAFVLRSHQRYNFLEVINRGWFLYSMGRLIIQYRQVSGLSFYQIVMKFNKCRDVYQISLQSNHFRLLSQIVEILLFFIIKRLLRTSSKT